MNNDTIGFIQIQGELVTETATTVTYFGMDTLPRTPHGEVMLNGGTIRGPLRKAALNEVRRLVAENAGISEKGLFSITDEYMLGTGYDRTRQVNNEKASGADPAGEIRLRTLNPLLSLFGRWGLGGRLATSEMRAPEACVMTAGQGARSDHFERDVTQVEMLSEEDAATLEKEIQANRAVQKQIDDAKKALATLGKEYRAADTDKLKKAVGKRMDEQKKVIEELEESREGGEHAIKHPLAGAECIAAGSTLSSSFELVEGKPVYLGIFLRALSEFSRNPHIGAGTSKGWGRIRGEYRVTARRAGQTQPDQLGTVRFDANGFHLEGDVLQQAFDDLPSMIQSCNFKVHTLQALREFEAAQQES